MGQLRATGLTPNYRLVKSDLLCGLECAAVWVVCLIHTTPLATPRTRAPSAVSKVPDPQAVAATSCHGCSAWRCAADKNLCRLLVLWLALHMARCAHKCPVVAGSAALAPACTGNRTPHPLRSDNTDQSKQTAEGTTAAAISEEASEHVQTPAGRAWCARSATHCVSRR